MYQEYIKNNVLTCIALYYLLKVPTRGGEGQFLSRILKLPGCEHVNGDLFHFPVVIERAKKFVAKEGIPDNRITFTMGNLLKDVPQSTKVDTIIVKNLFVIFTDDEMNKILENCHEVRIKGE